MGNDEKTRKTLHYVQDVPWPPRRDWGADYLITNRERRTRGSHDFKFIVPKGHKDIFRSSFFPRTITEWNKLPQETVSSQSLYF